MKIKSIFLSLLMLVLLFPNQVFAAGKIDMNEPVSLTIHYENEGVKLENVQFHIYQIANVDEYGNYTSTDSFSEFDVNITDGDAEKWNALSTTILGYVLRDEIEPTTVGYTNSEGNADFVNQDPGLYLVYGLNHVQGGYVYMTKPFFVQLPGVDNNNWVYHIVASPKLDKITKEPVDIHVVKQWHDKGHEKARPEEIVVYLLREGIVYDTVTLCKENNWRYMWKELESEYTWHVVEKEVKGYSVKVEREGNTFIINNTYDVPPPPPPPKLEQTGVLWWPVPVLLVGGLCFVTIGLIMNKKDEEYHEI